jgi:formylglycine-generating enzyme required for sulfatase activity
MQVILTCVTIFVLLWVAGFGVWWQFMRPAAPDHSNEVIDIPAGEFLFGEKNEKQTIPEFNIDKYEVTMGEYALFLQYLAAHGNPTNFDSPVQPAGRSHVPRDWDIYYGRASSSFSSYRTVRGVPINLDCPVFNVDYFDAYAYAKWKGRRLPSEMEWEKAARGLNGNIYPWGNEWDPKKTNSGADYQSDPPPGYKPAVDGFTWWAPVQELKEDRSPFGVMGMGGNVSEWTDTWDESKTYVIIKGGNFKSTADQAKTTTSIRQAMPQTIRETLGFRTAGDGGVK